MGDFDRGSNRWPFPKRCRRLFVAVFALVGTASLMLLSLESLPQLPNSGSIRLLGKFIGGSIQPALDYEDKGATAFSIPFLSKVVLSLIETLRFAVLGVSLAMIVGLVVGFLSTTSNWSNPRVQAPNWTRNLFARTIGRGAQLMARLVGIVARSTHELLWAVFLMAAIGNGPLTAVLAIAIPYTGAFSKIFAEIVEEMPPSVATSYQSLGSPPLQTFCFAILPQALPELLGYSLYRLEAGIRSSAIMGFFGIPTIGYYLRLSWDNTHYREVWSYLYALLFLLTCFDLASGVVRKGLTSKSKT